MDEVLFQGSALFKLASVGMFVDSEWDAVYIVVRIGWLRVYGIILISFMD